MRSCFGHAVHLAEAAFLTALSPKKKGRGGKDVPILEVPADPIDGDYDPEDEDTEEDIKALETEIDQAIAELPPGSDEAKLLAGLLVKVRGFITKVRSSPNSITDTMYSHRGRSAARHRPRHFFESVVSKQILKFLSSCLTARHGGVHGMMS